MRTIVFLLLFSLIYASCSDSKTSAEANVLAEVNGNFLYKDDLQAALPYGLSYDDSVMFARNYIRNWAENILLYDVAKENIKDNLKVDELVENYRRSLIVHSYQQELVNQRVSTNISEDEIAAYYEDNKEAFVVKTPLIKGLFIKVPVNAPRLNDVRDWYRTETYDAVENLEKYSLLNAVSYDYFYDKWTLVSDILAKMPLKGNKPEEYINKNRHIELQDTEFYYFLNVTEYLNEGDQEPYDFARLEAKDMLINIKKIDFMRNQKTDMFNEAIRKNKIKSNYLE
ncbi:peptidylprolyl isomerase [Bacteroides sp. 519]|uniref:peptidylprolyl isomerase n=1 Tax=Bacteroides sp. 519 TaxID=2302937 RepID=UPI0013D80A75|nr:peptidylprolyl isomerase [Bacteroides sp. 519]NDV59935.1 peptidyl-prolyl cis-trans isomerase [Bacteroides sp. 519]